MINNKNRELRQIALELCEYDLECEWFEFTENWFEANELGQYNSALSNSAVIAGRKFCYFVWGINDESHEIVGTFFNCNKDVKNEPIKHYLSRLINPDINFVFDELTINNKRVVVLSIPAASSVPTFYKGERYIRISSSKANLKKYHQKKHIYLKFFDRVFLR